MVLMITISSYVFQSVFIVLSVSPLNHHHRQRNTNNATKHICFQSKDTYQSNL